MLVLAAIVLAIPATAAAAPTARFRISPASPHQNQLVTYTQTGPCDVAPCTSHWYHPEEFATGWAQNRTTVSFTYTGTPGLRTVQLTVTNAKGVSASVTRSFTLLAGSAADTTAPNTAMTSGPGDTTSTSASMAFSSSETNSTFACSRDAGAYAACTDPKTYTALATGAHNFKVRAADATGNVDATPATWSWTVNQPAGDTTAPNTSITSGPSDPTTSSAASIGFNSSETGSTFACSMDAAAYASCTSPKGYTALATGAHSFSVRATDPAGNVDATPATWSWTVSQPAADTTAPTTTITSAPSSGTSTSASASFTGADDVAVNRFDCSLDAGAYATCTSAKTYSALATGSHTFSVRAWDAAGNVDATPATATWTVSAPSQGGSNCMPKPSACGYPDMTNTGTLPGITRTAVSGTVTLSTAGQLYENKTVTGSIVVTASNVTIRNVKVINTAYWAISSRSQNGNPQNLQIQDVEIDLQGDEDSYGILEDNFTAVRTLIHNGSDCGHLGANATFRDSFCSVGPDTNNDGYADSTTFCNQNAPGSSSPPHFDGYSTDGGSNQVYDHNTIRNPCSQTSAILISSNSGSVSKVSITDNLLDGGGYTLYCAATSPGVSGGETVTGNRIARNYRPQGGYYGPVAYCSGGGVTSWGGNVWDDTGASISQ
jgi:hypothetical protein